MTEEDFKGLGPGDIVIEAGRDYAKAFIVMVNYGGRVTAARTADLTNPLEWTLLRKVKSA